MKLIINPPHGLCCKKASCAACGPRCSELAACNTLAHHIMQRRADGTTVDTSTYLRVFGRAPLQLRCFKANGEPALRRSESVTERLVPSNAKPLQKLFLKHYTILVRLHAIGTPSTRQGPDRWLLEARTHAPRIASFLSPAPTRLALAAFPGEPDRRWSCKDLLGDGSRRKLESFYK